MAKKRQREQPKPWRVVDGNRVLVTTSRGVTVECLPIASTIEAHEENVRSSIEWPETPTRAVTDVAGSVEEIPLSDEYIKSGYATEEEAEAWEEYQAEQARAQAEFDGKYKVGVVRLLSTEGVRILDADEDAWVKRHEWLNMTVPDDPGERILHFFRTEVLGNIESDLAAIMAGITFASGGDEELIRAAENSFRTEMERARRAKALDDTGDPATEGQAREAGLVDQPDVDGGGGQAVAEPDAGSMGQGEPE
jgi:hypothetical protein